MKVEIVDIDRTTPIPIRNGAVLGYPGRFRCPITAGAAANVPYGNREDALRSGAKISVETDQESISEFRILPAKCEMRMMPLVLPGDYEIVGEVSMVHEDGVAFINVEGFRFVVDSNDTGGMALRTGDYVFFKLHQLSLWGENI